MQPAAVNSLESTRHSSCAAAHKKKMPMPMPMKILVPMLGLVALTVVHVPSASAAPHPHTEAVIVPPGCASSSPNPPWPGRDATDEPFVPSAGWPVTHDAAGSGQFWSAGNHRFAIKISHMPPSSNGTAVVTVPWRRHDTHPELKDTFIVDARSHLRVPRCARVHVSGDNATFAFEASNGPGEYHIYYMPFTTCEYNTGSCPYGANVVYDAPSGCTDAPWWGSVPLDQMAEAGAVVQQARTSFDAFNAMEKAASNAEVLLLLSKYKAADPTGSAALPAVLLSQDRSLPIRMTSQIPYTWTKRNDTEPVNYK